MPSLPRDSILTASSRGRPDGDTGTVAGVLPDPQVQPSGRIRASLRAGARACRLIRGGVKWTHTGVVEIRGAQEVAGDPIRSVS
jgi:hypothetical protein